MNGTSHQERAHEFLRVAHLFRLGRLPTEQPHPETRLLSHWARKDLPTAVSVLKHVDLRALERSMRYAGEVDALAARIGATLDAGKRIFLCGCGATGRLSLSLEFLWRESSDDDRVVSFMAGGDVALVQSLEGFEDHHAYGARHLEEMGFTDGDLLISCTEGGETPYVIGATERASELSSNHPYFLYCNADAVLANNIERFQRIYENPKVRKICLFVGPMALAGSTRMQASTILQLAVGLALLHRGEGAAESIAMFHRIVDEIDFSFLADFIARESDLYLAGHLLHYVVRDYGITVFTDTTERAPTFSLVPFERSDDRPGPFSLCYVSLETAKGPERAWEQLLNRPPRALDWPEIDPRTTSRFLQGYDFSVHALERRRVRIPDKRHHVFRIRGSDRGIALALDGLSHEIPGPDLPDLFRHLVLKQILNIHSTLVMGRLGRYENNLMTWVTPTNGKLVDRAARYVEHLLAAAGRSEYRYEAIVRQLFAEMESAPPGESVVLRTYRALMGS